MGSTARAPQHERLSAGELSVWAAQRHAGSCLHSKSRSQATAQLPYCSTLLATQVMITCGGHACSRGTGAARAAARAGSSDSLACRHKVVVKVWKRDKY